MKIRERREAAEQLVNDINNTIRDINYYKSDTHGNSYYLYALWPTGTKITFIIGVTVATMLLLGVKITGAIIPSLPLAIVLLFASMILYWSPGYRKYRLIHWNTKKAIRWLREDAARFEERLKHLRIESDAMSKKQLYVNNYGRYAKRRSEVQDEVAIYKLQFEALYDIVRTELGGEVQPAIERDGNGREFESEIGVNITLPLIDCADHKTKYYEFTKHDFDELVIKIIELRPVIRERKQSLKEVGIPTA